MTRYTARPTVYRGIRMRSRLEARAASMLDAAGVDWQYEPQAYRADDGEYLPDFQIGPTTFVEVKPWLDNNRDRRLQVLDVRRYATILSEAVPGAVLWCLYSTGTVVLVCGRGYSDVWLYFGWCALGHGNLIRRDGGACLRCGGELVADTAAALAYVS